MSMTLRAALDTYLEDCSQRGHAKSTLGGKRSAFAKLTAAISGQTALADASRADLRRFAGSLRGKPGARKTVLVHVRAFLYYCVREEWIEKSPMAGMAMPKETREPTQPLSRDEMRALLRAAPEGSADRALLLLMRYSGLAIGDAAALQPGDVRDEAVIWRRAKTGALCCIPLPAAALQALAALAVRPGGHWFWSGVSELVTNAKMWRSRLKAIAVKAGVAGFHPHRLRDTFAVELLLDGVAIEDVAKLLGHSSIEITERYYAPWNGARLERLRGVVRSAHARDPVLAEIEAPK